MEKRLEFASNDADRLRRILVNKEDPKSILIEDTDSIEDPRDSAMLRDSCDARDSAIRRMNHFSFRRDRFVQEEANKSAALIDKASSLSSMLKVMNSMYK